MNSIVEETRHTKKGADDRSFLSPWDNVSTLKFRPIPSCFCPVQRHLQPPQTLIAANNCHQRLKKKPDKSTFQEEDILIEIFLVN